jgi:hypothetical protein
VKWRKITRQKEASGWGIKNIHIFREASISKSIWRIIHGEEIWGKVMNETYL